MKRLSIRTQIMSWSVLGLAMLVATVGYTPAAFAHGEKSQAAFLRMRTIHWYDLNWSTDKLKVNDEMSISGKFHVFKNWPEAVALPTTSFLNIGIPGPVFIRTESYIGDRFVPRSVSLELGKTYDFKVVLKARRPGRWHVHSMINVEAGGPIISPAKWVTIEGSLADFKNPVTTLTGQTVDLERFALGGIVGWHLFWAIVGIAWIWYWARRPTFLPRWAKVQSGDLSGLVTDTDKRVGMGFLAGTLAVVAFGYWNANANYPITVPLQAGILGVMTPIAEDQKVDVKLERSTFRVPGREIVMRAQVTNNSDTPIEVGEFATANVRFLNPNVLEDDTGYPENLLADEGLSVDDPTPIGPGETRTITISAQDAAWETERLADLVYDPDTRFGGMLFFFDSAGTKHMVPIGGPLIPDYS